MNPVMLVCALLFLVQGIVALARPSAMLAFEDWIATRLWKRPPLPQGETRVRTMGLIETVLGALLLATTLS